MNQLMIQQAVSTVRMLQGKTASAGSAGRGQNVLDFAAIAQNALGADGMDAPDNTAGEATNPLAALLLAALFVQPQTNVATTEDTDQPQTQERGNQGVEALSPQAVAPEDKIAWSQNLVSVLQDLGMDQTEAQDFAQQLAQVLQTAQKAAPAASPVGMAHAAEGSRVWAAAQQAVQPATAEPTAAPTPAAEGTVAASTVAPQRAQQPDTADPIAQVRHLLGKLLGEALAPAEHTQRSQSQPDTQTVLSLRTLLTDLQAAQQATAAAPTASAAGDTQQDTADGQDASTDTGLPTATVAQPNGNPAPVAFADGQSADAAVEQAPRRTLQEAFDTMVDTISTLRNSAKSEMEIHLKPDFLGKVVIKLTMEEGSLVARISASSSGVQDAFQAQAPQLTTALQQSGIKDVTVLVTHDMASGSALDQSTARQQHNPREQRRRNWAVQQTTDTNDATRATAAYEQFWRNGSINYLA